MAYEFDGAPYEKRTNMLATRHARYPGAGLVGRELHTGGVHGRGVQAHGKAWRNGRTRSTGRDETIHGLAPWRHDEPGQINGRYLDLDERIEIANMLRAGMGVRTIVADMGRSGEYREPRASDGTRILGAQRQVQEDARIPQAARGNAGTCQRLKSRPESDDRLESN